VDIYTLEGKSPSLPSLMLKTKVMNKTGSNIILKVGSMGVFHTLCSKLENDKTYTIKVDSNGTYREYWCSLLPDEDKALVLGSDDYMDYEELHIKVKEDKQTITWDAYKRFSHKLVVDAGEKKASEQLQPQVSSSTSGPYMLNRVLNKLKDWFLYLEANLAKK